MEKNKKHINSSIPFINIHCKVPCPGLLLNLIENAEIIHLWETCATNFIYHCQIRKIINIDDKIIYLDLTKLFRDWDYLNLDYAYKMYTNPKLDNWEFIFPDQ